MNKISLMAKGTKTEMMLRAILSKDKQLFREALKVGKPEKRIIYLVDKDSRIHYMNRIISRQEMDEILKEWNKNYNLKVIELIPAEGCHPLK